MPHRISGTLLISIASVSLLFGSLVARAAEFDAIVRSIQQQTGCRQTHVPMFWLARAVVAVGRPAGTSQLKLAIFERPTIEPERFSEAVDGALGLDWKPMVRVRSQDGEVTSIFFQENGGRTVRLLIATKDREDAVLMQVRLDVGHLLHFVDEHQHAHTSDSQ